MNEPFRPDDDLVSSVLDGEATAEERARVDADPTLTARLAEFRRVRALVGEAVPPRSDTERDGAIAAAVTERNRSDQVVTALRARRDPRNFLAVAAGLLFVLLAAGFLVTQTGQDDAADSGDAAAGSADDSGGGAEAATDDTAAELSASGAGRQALGEIADQDALRAALQDILAPSNLDAVEEGNEAPSATTTTRSQSDGELLSGFANDPVPGASTDCGVRLAEADAALTGFLLRARATYAETPAVVYVFPGEADAPQVVVVSADGCELLDLFRL